MSSINQLLDEKFMSQNKFSIEIETLVKTNKGSNYLETIIEFCNEKGIELEMVPKLLSKPLKEKLRCEAIELNYLKPVSKARLSFT